MSPATLDVPGVNEHAARSLTGVLNDAGYGVCTNVVAPGRASELPQWRVDGAAIVYGQAYQGFDALARERVPFVCVNHRHPGVGSVVVDDVSGTLLAMRHLMSAGHARIAYATTPRRVDPPHYSWVDRRAAYERAMREAGRESAVWVVRPFDEEAVVGGTPTAMTAPLTVVRLPSAKIGERAAAMLRRRMSGEVPPTTEGVVVLPEQLVKRESVGPPRSGPAPSF